MAKGIKPRNYSFLNKFTYYKPDVGGMFTLLGMLLLSVLACTLLIPVFVLMFGMEDGLLYGEFVTYPLMFVIPMIYSSVRSRNNSFTFEGLKLDSNHFSPLGGALCVLMVMVATIAAAFCGDAIGTLLPQMPEEVADRMKMLLTGDKVWISFLMACVFAPFFEEWLCRGMVLRGLLANRIKPVWAIIISAVFFAAIHLNIWQAVPAFLLGCLFGYVYYRTGSLKLTMLMHFTNNAMALVLGNVEGFEEYESWVDVFPGGYYWIIFAASVLLLVLTVRAFARIRPALRCTDKSRHLRNPDDHPARTCGGLCIRLYRSDCGTDHYAPGSSSGCLFRQLKAHAGLFLHVPDRIHPDRRRNADPSYGIGKRRGICDRPARSDAAHGKPLPDQTDTLHGCRCCSHEPA